MRCLRIGVWVVVTSMAVACGGAQPGGTAAGGGGGATATPGSPGGGQPTPGGGTAQATAAGGGVSFQPIPGAGPTGVPAADLAGIPTLLGPGDFNGFGVPGAGTPKVNLTSGPRNVYVVYARASGADGGIEFDIFVLDTAAEAATDFGESGADALDAASLQSIGADKGWFEDDQPTNDNKGSYAELRILKGRFWFVITIPSGPQAKDQLLGLAGVVIKRAAALV